MSDGNRGRFRSALIWLIAGTYLGIALYIAFDAGRVLWRQSVEADRQTNQYAVDAKQRINESCANVADLKECVAETIKATRENQLAENDLKAQREMAFWAKGLLIAALAQLGASGFGIWALVRTIDQGHEGLRTARDSLTETKISNERQLRAYVAVKPHKTDVDGPETYPRITWIKNKAGERVQRRITFRAVATNFGQTPAHKIGHTIHIVLVERGEPPPWPIWFAKTDATLWPTGSRAYDIPFKGYTTDIEDKIKDGKAYLLVNGRFEYTDAFGKLRYTNFRFKFNDRARRVNRLIMSHVHNDAN